MEDTYTEIMKCWKAIDEDHASTSFEFGLMNDLYYQMFAPIYEEN